MVGQIRGTWQVWCTDI